MRIDITFDLDAYINSSHGRTKMLSLGIFFSCAHIILYSIAWARWIGSLRCCYDIILEIGPGTGNLMKKLLEAGKSVVAVELDPRTVLELQHHFQGTPLSNQLKKMSMGDFLSIQPSELKFSIDLMKQSLCSMHLANKTDWYIAFKTLFCPIPYAMSPVKNIIIVIFGFISNFYIMGFQLFIYAFRLFHNVFTMQAHKESPMDMQCGDKFLIHSVVALKGASNKDLTQSMAVGKVVDEFRLSVYVPANPPSPVLEREEEWTSPRTSLDPLLRMRLENLLFLSL